MTAEQHPFDAALALTAMSDGLWQGRTSAAYANMVGPYGGLTAAQALHAVLLHPQRLGEPVALTVNFAAPIGDGPFLIEAMPVRTNRSTQHWTMAMRQNDEVVLRATGITAQRRETWSTREALMPQAPPPDAVPLPNWGMPMPWLQRYEMRFIDGEPPRRWEGQDSAHTRTRLWIRDVPARPLDFASLVAMADVFFPRILRRRATLVPLGTVSMTVYFHAREEQLRTYGSGHVLGQVQGQGFAHGYFDHSGQLWSASGQLLATTHQIVYFKE